MILPCCTKVFPFLSQFFCRAFPNIFPICCRCLAACHARCCNMLCTRQLSKTKKLPCNTSCIDWQEHGNRLMEPWLVNCKRNTSGTAKKSVRKTIERRTTSLTVAADLPMCRFFPDIHSLFVASNLRACRSILPFLSATTYQPVGRHGW